MKVVNQTRNRCLARKVIMADSFLARMKGLLGKPGPDPECCLILKPCNSVHTMFMRFPIDVLFLDSSGRIVGMEENLAPYRLSGPFWKSRLAVELPAGTLAASGTAAGDLIKIIEG